MIRSRYVLMLLVLLTAARCAFGATAGAGDEVGARLDQARLWYAERKDEEALAAFMSVLEVQEDHYDALWHAVMLHLAIGHRSGDARDTSAHYARAYALAQLLLEAHPEAAGAHFAYAAAVGRRAEQASARDRARLSVTIRRHAEQAIALDPEYAGAWNVLGVWHHRAANVSRVGRMAANLLLGRDILEGASNEEARKAFDKAIELDPSFILFYKDKAEFLLTIGDTAGARTTLEQGLALDEVTEDDPRWKQMMREWLSEL